MAALDHHHQRLMISAYPSKKLVNATRLGSKAIEGQAVPGTCPHAGVQVRCLHAVMGVLAVLLPPTTPGISYKLSGEVHAVASRLAVALALSSLIFQLEPGQGMVDRRGPFSLYAWCGASACGTSGSRQPTRTRPSRNKK